jgi:predicted RNase H-like nuclease (RuvC/YqgF family)
MKPPTHVTYEVFSEAKREIDRLRRSHREKDRHIEFLESRLGSFQDQERHIANRDQRSAARQAAESVFK